MLVPHDPGIPGRGPSFSIAETCACASAQALTPEDPTHVASGTGAWRSNSFIYPESPPAHDIVNVRGNRDWRRSRVSGRAHRPPDVAIGRRAETRPGTMATSREGLGSRAGFYSEFTRTYRRRSQLSATDAKRSPGPGDFDGLQRRENGDGIEPMAHSLSRVRRPWPAP